VSVLVLDTIWILGVLLVALACLWYVRAGQQLEDPAIVVGGIVAAVVFVLAALLYWWLVWGS